VQPGSVTPCTVTTRSLLVVEHTNCAVTVAPVRSYRDCRRGGLGRLDECRTGVITNWS